VICGSDAIQSDANVRTIGAAFDNLVVSLEIDTPG
jgi:hypothetical protein